MPNKFSGNEYPHELHLPTTDEMLGWIGDMYAFGPRRAGTAADHNCEDYLADALTRAGFEKVRKDSIPIRVWEADEFKLAISPAADEPFADIPAHYIPYTKHTPPDGIEGRLMYVDPHDPSRYFKSCKGRIVVADIRFPKLDVDEIEKFSFGRHDPSGAMKGTTRFAVWVRMYWSMYLEAARRGAAGFIGVLADHYAGGQNYYAPYGFKEKDIHDKPIPGFWVDRVQGAEIRALAKKGTALARLLLTGTLKKGVTHNVIGEIPGQTDERFILACHHDSPFASAVEDASGCAVVLAAAGHFARARELRKTLVVMFTAGHFYGSIGTRTYIERNKGKSLDRTALEMHVEHIGREANEKADGTLEVLDRPEFTGVFIPFNRSVKNAVMEAIVEQDLDRSILLPAEGPFGEFPPTDGGDFHLEGVPVVNFISPPLYLLNAEDTLDKVAAPRLLPATRAAIQILRRLDPVPLKTLRSVDYPLRAVAMRLLSHVVYFRSIAMGIR